MPVSKENQIEIRKIKPVFKIKNEIRKNKDKYNNRNRNRNRKKINTDNRNRNRNWKKYWV